MEEYDPPLEEIRFALRHHARLPEIVSYPAFADTEVEIVDALLSEAGKFMSEVVSPLNRIGDTEGARMDAGRVVMPAGFSQAWSGLVAAGWNAIAADEEYGGSGLPYCVQNVVLEMFTAANMSFALVSALTDGAIDALFEHADDPLKKLFLRPLIAGKWTACMDLTEPDAGSDLAALRCQAEPRADGSFAIRGSKVFITFGDHDLTENIIHLLLARTVGAPPGSRGISLFVVPKRRVEPDGSLGGDNGIKVVQLEHKLGIHASPTCALSFGEDTPTIGYLIGEEHRGLPYMFTMMNRERILAGNQGLALSQRAYQKAVAYARERKQGRAIGLEPASGERSPIVEHADVRRMLLTMRSRIEAMRALLYMAAGAVDTANHHSDAVTRTATAARLALITPVVKSWLTDLGVENTSIGIQVHGGVGYIEETGAAQYLRDSRSPPIYEGTNGVQAMDLVLRKIPMENGEVVRGLITSYRDIQRRLAEADGESGELANGLAGGIDALEQATAWLLERRGDDPRSVAAGASPYTRLFGSVAGAVHLAEGLLAATDENESDWSPGFLEDKRTIARFYIEQLLPHDAALLPAVTAGAEILYAIESDSL